MGSSLLTCFELFQVLLFPRWGWSRDSATAESQAEFVRSGHQGKNPNGRDNKGDYFLLKLTYLMLSNFFVFCVVSR